MTNKKYSSKSLFTDLANGIHHGYKVIIILMSPGIYTVSRTIFTIKKFVSCVKKVENTFHAYFLTVLHLAWVF